MQTEHLQHWQSPEDWTRDIEARIETHGHQFPAWTSDRDEWSPKPDTIQAGPEPRRPELSTDPRCSDVAGIAMAITWTQEHRQILEPLQWHDKEDVRQDTVFCTWVRSVSAELRQDDPRRYLRYITQELKERRNRIIGEAVNLVSFADDTAAAEARRVRDLRRLELREMEHNRVVAEQLAEDMKTVPTTPTLLIRY